MKVALPNNIIQIVLLSDWNLDYSSNIIKQLSSSLSLVDVRLDSLLLFIVSLTNMKQYNLDSSKSEFFLLLSSSSSKFDYSLVFPKKH